MDPASVPFLFCLIENASEQVGYLLVSQNTVDFCQIFAKIRLYVASYILVNDHRELELLCLHLIHNSGMNNSVPVFWEDILLDVYGCGSV